MINIQNFQNFLNEKLELDNINERADFKDTQRVSDIISKAAGNLTKEVDLTTRMATSIKDIDKCIGRADAAMTLNKPNLAQIFLDKAKELNPDMHHKFDMTGVQMRIDDFIRKHNNQKDFIAKKDELDKSDYNKDGIFYNVGIPAKFNQKDSKEVSLFKYSLTRIVQNLAGQMHVWVDVKSFNEEKGELYVKVSPNFTFPKNKVLAAYKEYPKLLADYLNTAIGSTAVKADKGSITITHDMNYKRLVAATVLADIKHGYLKI